MQATGWEFANRAVIFGIIIGVPFALYSLDHENATAIIANWLGPKLNMDPDLLARPQFAFAALVLAVAAWYWGFAAAILGFAITLKLEVFFIVTAVSVGSFWILTSLRQRK
jgi:hypothetical protein